MTGRLFKFMVRINNRSFVSVTTFIQGENKKMIYPFQASCLSHPDKADNNWSHACSFDITTMLAWVGTIAVEGKNIGYGPLMIAASVIP